MDCATYGRFRTPHWLAQDAADFKMSIKLAERVIKSSAAPRIGANPFVYAHDFGNGVEDGPHTCEEGERHAAGGRISLKRGRCPNTRHQRPVADETLDRQAGHEVRAL